MSAMLQGKLKAILEEINDTNHVHDEMSIEGSPFFNSRQQNLRRNSIVPVPDIVPEESSQLDRMSQPERLTPLIESSQPDQTSQHKRLAPLIESSQADQMSQPERQA
ncbi:hypothetical protein ACA910_014992 [Epithemia clementina (nom. ined.)]